MMMRVLAQSGGGGAIGPTLVWIGAIMALVIGGFFVIAYVRRRMLERETDAAMTGTLFEQLRELKRRGQLSEEEYEAARRSMTKRTVERLDRSAERPKGVTHRSSTGPQVGVERDRDVSGQ